MYWSKQIEGSFIFKGLEEQTLFFDGGVVRPHCRRTCCKGNTVIYNLENICYEPHKNSRTYEEKESST